MDNAQMNGVVEQLKKLGIGDAWKTTTFGMVRESKTHGTQSVTVEVHERVSGPGARFFAIATSDRGQKAAGNPADRLDVVLATLHWSDLDK